MAFPQQAQAAAQTHRIGGINVRNTANLINPDTRLCAMVYSPPKFGKTTLAATLNKLTLKTLNKPTLFIAVEAGEGGGTMSIQDAGVDYVCPEDYNEFQSVLAALQTDTFYGGVVLDSATEYVNRYLKPYALNFPSRERIPTRSAGVPERSDYQTMGEKARKDFNQLISLTTKADTNIRKHLIVTALERSKEDNGAIVAIQPDLPGAMSGAATAMFQTVAQVAIRGKVVKDPTTGQPSRITERVLVTGGDGVRVVGDRTHVFPTECTDMDLLTLWEKYWVPQFNKG